jgi:hypothetical protein
MLTNAQLPHAVAFLLLLARIGDVGSTYLISPTLKLEANPIIRRLRWPALNIQESRGRAHDSLPR